MMMWLVNSSVRTQRGVALALIMIAASFLLTVLLVFNRQFAVRNAHLTELRQLAGRLAAFSSQIGQGTLPIQDLNAASDIFFTASSLNIAKADLQSKVEQLAQANGLGIASIGSTPDMEWQGLRFIGIRADLAGSQDAIYALMLDLEQSTPSLVVREASLRITGGELGDRPVEMGAQIQVFALVDPDIANETGTSAP
jgi:hypothetical protein